ncbi:MAG: SGNH/GDSL hydrolase family protein [Lachnospiraceae bacterium]|nr:SGNH/GDSL hydrolase family protein [Lachnospiraceae bacterium]
MTNKELKNIYFGAYSFEETEDGYLQAFQYSKPQMEYFKGAFDFWYERCSATTAKTIEFLTEATKISFGYRIIWKGSEDSFELMVDGLISEIVYVKDVADEGTIEWSLPEGRKSVVIYLPADATVLLKNFAINAGAERPEKTCKVLWLGDSITQGYGPLRSAETYVSIANRLLGYDIINQGIGGYVYDKKSLMPMEGYHPDKIIVALGTNQYGTESMKDVEEYYETLMSIYGNDIPVLCISPIWRGDHPEEAAILERFCENVKRIAGSYSNVKVIDGFRLVPHLSEYFLDNLHPNCLGTETYGRNLVLEMQRISF